MPDLMSYLKFVTRWLAIGLGLWHLFLVSGYVSVSTLEIRIVHLSMMLVLIFLGLAERRIAALPQGASVSPLALGIDLASAIAAAGAGYYLYSRWLSIAMSGGITTRVDAYVGMAIIALVMLAVIRRIGWFLAGFMTTSAEGVYGIPLGVSATFIIMFSIFGAFLNAFGAGDFFFQISSRATRGASAASAKTAVVFSTLLGMSSGSAAGNVAVTGTSR